MSEFNELLKANTLGLIVSLPKNSPEMAQAAIDGGADALKVHINLKHKAAKINFGTLKDERENIEKILSVAKNIPVGIVPGHKKVANQEEMEILEDMGINFFDVYYEDLKEYMLNLKKMKKVVAITPDYTVDQVIKISRLNIDAIEAAIISSGGYGESLIVGDLQNYITIVLSTNLPVIIPTQRKIQVSEVPIVWDTGVKSLMIGAIVTGKTPKSILKATQEYRNAIDDLS